MLDCRDAELVSKISGHRENHPKAKDCARAGNPHEYPDVTDKWVTDEHHAGANLVGERE